MSFAAVRPYFRARLDTLKGFEEWEDAFNVNNIPRNIINLSYHIDTTSATNINLHHRTTTYSQVVVIRFFIKGFRKPAEAIDKAMQQVDAVMDAILIPSERVTQAGLDNVVPGNISLDPIADSNDNTVVVSIDFNCQVSLDISR